MGRRRRRLLPAVLAALGLTAIALRVALPYALDPWLEEQLAASVGGQVEIGDVDLALLRGRIVLEDGVLHTRRDPPTPDTPQSRLAWDRLALRISWPALLERHVRIRGIAFASPQLRLVRTEGGGFDLGDLFAGEAEPDASDPGPDWRVSIDQGQVREGRIRFRDLEVEGDVRIRARLTDLRVTRIAFEPGSYERAGRFELDASADGASLHASGELQARAEGTALSVQLTLDDLSLEAVQAYLGPQLGWQQLRGNSRTTLSYERDPGSAGRVRGTLETTDVEVYVAETEQRALAWDRLEMRDAEVDLESRRIRVENVALHAGSLLVIPSGPEVPAFDEPSQADADAPIEPAPAAPPDAPDWRWQVDSLEITDESTLRLAGREERPVTLELEASRVGPEASFPLALTLSDQEGSLTADGSARLQPLGFEGRIDWNALDVARLLAMLLPGQATWLTQATANGSIQLERVQPADPDAAPRLDTSGEIALTDVVLRGDEGGLFQANLDRLDVRLDALRPPGGEASGWTASVSEVTAVSPEVRLTMLEEGLVLPPFEPEAGGAGAEVDAAAEPSTEAAPADSGAVPDATAVAEPGADAPAGSGAEAGPAAFTLQIAHIALRDGTLAFQDRRVRPFLSVDLSAVSGELADLSLPDTAIGHLRLDGQALDETPVSLEGALRDGVFEAEIEAERLPLPPFNPYVTSWSDYRVEDGSASADLELVSAPDRLALDLDLVLHDFGLRGQQGALFRDRFGVPIHVALALLRDAGGDIALAVPIERSASVTEVNLVSLLGHAVGQALVNSLVSPLKVLGSVRTVGTAVGAAAGNLLLRGGSRIEAFEPDPIAFLPGRAEPSDAGMDRIAGLARILAEHPALAIRLTPRSVAADAEWLGQDDATAPDDPVLRELARARAERVETLLVSDHGIPAERIVRSGGGEPAPGDSPQDAEEQAQPASLATPGSDGPPRVEIELDAS